MNIIGETIIGSHVWKMNHSGSDTDIFRIYQEPSISVLDGTAKKASFFEQGDTNEDIAIHEVEKVIIMLMNGNVNFIIGVMSPLVNKNSLDFQELRELYLSNISKNCYHSIKGMATSNYQKYGKLGKLDEKKWNQITRLLKFGINIMDGRGIIFEPSSGGNEETFNKLMLELDESYKSSSLVENPIPDSYRIWLRDIRLGSLLRELE